MPTKEPSPGPALKRTLERSSPSARSCSRASWCEPLAYGSPRPSYSPSPSPPPRILLMWLASQDDRSYCRRESGRKEATGMNSPEETRAFVLNAFDTLFNRRDYDTAATFWSPHYIQHSAHIPPGRDGLFDLVRAAPPDMRYENHVAAADGNHVLLHGRFTSNGRPRAWVAGDVIRVENGVIVEHWDTLQDEAAREESKSGPRCLETASRTRNRSSPWRGRARLSRPST